MKSLIYNLLSKGLLLVVLLSAAATYYYRADLLPEWFEQDAVINSAAAPDAVESQEERSVQAPSGSAGQLVSTGGEGGSAPVEPSTSERPAESGVAPVAVDAPEPVAVQPTTDVSESVTPAVESVPAGQASPLARARQAYWAGDQNAAIARYKEAIASRPDDPEAHGELGNLYFSRGDWEAAASAYLDAGHRLIAQGKPRPAAHLVRVLNGLNPAYAQQLTRALRHAHVQQDIARP